MLVFSQDWAEAFHQAINANPDYAVSSKNWTAGALALMLVNTSGEDRAVVLDLHLGECRGVASTIAPEAFEKVAFVIAGNEADWQAVLSGDIQPIMALMCGKLRLRKGSMAKLMPYTKGAVELVSSAQTVPTTF